jgi:hypothetical protein
MIRPPGTAVPVAYGKFDGRQSAPTQPTFDDLAAVFSLTLPTLPTEADCYIRISWAGDTAQLRINGHPATDRFWDGADWRISLRDAGYTPGSALTLHILPIAAGSPVSLPRDARDRLLATSGQLLSLDATEVFTRTEWHQAAPA